MKNIALVAVVALITASCASEPSEIAYDDQASADVENALGKAITQNVNDEAFSRMADLQLALPHMAEKEANLSEQERQELTASFSSLYTEENGRILARTVRRHCNMAGTPQVSMCVAARNARRSRSGQIASL